MEPQEKFTKINTPEEYKDFVYKYLYIIDEQLKYLEGEIAKDNLGEVAEYLPPLISMVNTAGYLLTGNSRVREIISPVESGLIMIEDQRFLYQLEPEFDLRLFNIAKAISNSKIAESSKWRIKNYYMSWAKK